MLYAIIIAVIVIIPTPVVFIIYVFSIVVPFLFIDGAVVIFKMAFHLMRPQQQENHKHTHNVRSPPKLAYIFFSIMVLTCLVRIGVELKSFDHPSTPPRELDHHDVATSAVKVFDSMKTTSPSTACRLETQERLKPHLDQCFDQEIPALMNTFFIKGVYHMHFVDFHMDQRIRPEWHHASWYCNSDIPASLSNAMKNSYTGHFVVSCNVASNKLESIRVEKPSPVTNITPVYDDILQHHLKCDAILGNNDQPESKQPTPTVAACTAIRGGWPLDITWEWIEFHRLIGIEHFYIYINEPWNITENQNLLPRKPYITYIPYDFHLDNHRDHAPHTKKLKWYNFFQQAHMNDCLYMTRKHPTIQWVAMTDVDEYLYLDTNTSTTTTTTTLQKHLLQHSDLDKTCALQFNSFHFGGPTKKQEKQRNKATHPMVMDYLYRENIPDLSKAKKMRVKYLLRPDYVSYINVHYLIDYSKSMHKIDAQVARIQHYKHPWSGPHRSGPPKIWIVDSVMKDLYRQKVVQRMQE